MTLEVLMIPRYSGLSSATALKSVIPLVCDWGMHSDMNAFISGFTL